MGHDLARGVVTSVIGAAIFHLLLGRGDRQWVRLVWLIPVLVMLWSLIDLSPNLIDATPRPTGVTIDCSEITLNVEEEATLTATVTPLDADQRVTWRSSASKIAQVSSDGVVLARAPGTATVIAETVEGGHKATCTVTVKQPLVQPTAVTLDRTAIELDVGSYTTLKATVEPSNASDQRVSWTSSAPHVAQVSSDGVVSAVSAGTARMTVTTIDGEKKAHCYVVVSQPPALFVPAIEAFDLSVWTHYGEDIVTCYLTLDEYPVDGVCSLEFKKRNETWAQACVSTWIEESCDGSFYFGLYSELTQGNTYDFRVRLEKAGEYYHSESTSIVVPINDIEAPTNIRVESVGSTSITLSWDSVPKATQYVVHWYTPDDNLGHFTSDTYYTLDGLQPNTEYEVCVEARYDPGEGIHIWRESDFLIIRTDP